MKLSFKSFPVRLSFYISSLLLVFILAGMSLIGYLWFSDLTSMLREHGITTARETAYKLDRIFAQGELVAQNLATTLEHSGWSKKEIKEVNATLMPSVHESCPELSGLCISWKEGMLVPDEKYNTIISYEKNGGFVDVATSDESFDYWLKDWFTVPTIIETPVWTVPFKSELGMDSLLLSYSTPFYKNVDGERVVAGVVVADIRMNALIKYLKNLIGTENQELAEATDSFLLNQFGQVVLYPGKEAALNKTIFTLCDEPDEPDPRDREAARLIYKTHFGCVNFNQAPILSTGACSLFYATCMNDWVVCIAIPQGWMKSILLPLFAKFFLGWLLAIVLIVLVIFAISRRLGKPLTALASAAESVGTGNFSAPLPDSSYDDEIGHLTQSFKRMQTELVDYVEQLKITVAASERSRSELNAARAIQKDILPHILPPFTHYTNVRGAADLIPARGVGGDLYDVFPLDEDRLAIIIGDVSGKGIPAALFMAVTQTLQRSIALTEHEPFQLVNSLNKVLASDREASMFVTYWVGFLNIRTGLLTYTNGAHNPPLLKRADGQLAVLRERHGLPVGAIDTCQYTQATFQLSVGDTLILYTDGVTEAFNKEDAMFGEDRLLRLVENSALTDPTLLLMEIRDAVFEYTEGAEQSDDITILIIQYTDLEKRDE